MPNAYDNTIQSAISPEILAKLNATPQVPAPVPQTRTNAYNANLGADQGMPFHTPAMGQIFIGTPVRLSQSMKTTRSGNKMPVIGVCFTSTTGFRHIIADMGGARTELTDVCMSLGIWNPTVDAAINGTDIAKCDAARNRLAAEVLKQMQGKQVTIVHERKTLTGGTEVLNAVTAMEGVHANATAPVAAATTATGQPVDSFGF